MSPRHLSGPRLSKAIALRMPCHDEKCPVELRAQWAAARIRRASNTAPTYEVYRGNGPFGF